MTTPTVVSLFTGGMGLDLGFEEQGFEVKVALDSDAAVEATIRANGRDFPVVTRNVSDVTASYLLKKAGLKAGEATVVTGTPSSWRYCPCSTQSRTASCGSATSIGPSTCAARAAVAN